MTIQSNEKYHKMLNKEQSRVVINNVVAKMSEGEEKSYDKNQSIRFETPDANYIVSITQEGTLRLYKQGRPDDQISVKPHSSNVIVIK